MKRRLLALALAISLASACSSGQEPEIAPPSGGGPGTTSRSLQPCPFGGPDETTPPAGCLDDEGNVVRR